jgi:hypothetical protein
MDMSNDMENHDHHDPRRSEMDQHGDHDMDNYHGNPNRSDMDNQDGLRTVMPVINHVELANSVLNGSDAKIDVNHHDARMVDHRQTVQGIGPSTSIACN